MDKARKLIPLADRVLVRRLQPIAQSVGGILLPDSAQKKTNEAEVISVGDGARSRDGNLIPVSLKVGEKVLLPEFGGMSIKFDDQEFHLFREDDILAKLSE